MFVLPPPPPRYPNGMSPWGTGIPGGPIPIIETNNTIGHPKGPEYQFSVGEGTYVLREDIHLATPPPHPSEAPITNINPLSTAPHPISAGTKLSLVQIKYRDTPTHLYRSPTLSSSKVINGIDDSRVSLMGGETDDGSSLGIAASSSQASKSGDIPQKFGGGNASLAPLPTAGKPMKKPKNNIAKSNSSFVSRIITHEHLTKRLTERNSEDLLVFANVNRAFNWLDMGASNKQEPLSKILFTKAHPICHDVNMVTRSANHIDVIIGFSTGDIIWFDPISNKYARINKNGAINSHAVTEIKWLPGSENLFLAGHNDGSLVVYDKEKEDAPFMPEETSNGPAYSNGAAPASFMGFFNIKKTVKSSNQKFNPLSYWTVAKGPITAFQFSPDLEHIAVVSEDQSLRVINFMKEKLLDVYSSYYGGFTCVCWSPDGRYIVTGGQDDLVSIWSFAERRIVARCEGHHSWVSSVAFDPWRCDDRTYRFGSVGNDCRLLLWDFSVGMLHKPKAAAVQHRGSMSSAAAAYPAVTPGRSRGESQSMRLRSNSNVASVQTEDSTQSAVHPVEERARTAVLPPIMSKEIDPDPLTQLIFREDSIITTCVNGHLRTWDRPHIVDKADRNGSDVTLSAAGS
ncbi:WD40-repeat-containing domain protein [Geopyxis carbonaria]|nr:WD40-repeat-containing domain protein [Geopyxis carbonaria]